MSEVALYIFTAAERKGNTINFSHLKLAKARSGFRTGLFVPFSLKSSPEPETRNRTRESTCLHHPSQLFCLFRPRALRITQVSSLKFRELQWWGEH